MLRIFLFIACASTLAGCYSSHIIPFPELERLHGYDATSPLVRPALADDHGEVVTLDPGSRLWLYGADGVRRGGRIERVEIKNGVFWGRVSTGAELMVPMASVRYAQVQVFSPGRTAGLVVGLILGAAAAGAAIAVPLALRQPPGPGRP